jgi:competence protein ComGC
MQLDHDLILSVVLVYAIPNMAPKKKIMNKHELHGNIALVDRGEVTLIQHNSDFSD